LKQSADLFTQDPIQAVQLIQETLGHKEEDAALWLSRCSYGNTAAMSINQQVFETSLSVLKTIGLVQETFQVKDLWDKAASELVTIV